MLHLPDLDWQSVLLVAEPCSDSHSWTLHGHALWCACQSRTYGTSSRQCDLRCVGHPPGRACLSTCASRRLEARWTRSALA